MAETTGAVPGRKKRPLDRYARSAWRCLKRRQTSCKDSYRMTAPKRLAAALDKE